MKTPALNILIEAPLSNHLKCEPAKNLLHYAILESCQSINHLCQIMLRDCFGVLLSDLCLNNFVVISKTELSG